MKSRIQELKIANYKKRILSEYSFLNIKDVFYGVEDIANTNFSKKAINSSDIIIKEFNIYDPVSNAYIDEEEKYSEAISCFRDNLKFFDDDEDIIFNIIYNKESFRVLCPFFQFISNFDNINHFDESIMIYDRDLTKITSIFRMEYCYEVSSLEYD